MHEGNGIDTAWRFVCLAMAILLGRQTTAVPVPPLGVCRLNRARRRERLRPPLIDASVAHRKSHANKLLDIAQEGHLLGVAQRYRDTFRACARGTADPMYVGFRHVWQIEIHDVADAIDINAARRND